MNMVMLAGGLMLLAAVLYITAVLSSLRTLKTWHSVIFLCGFISDMVGTHYMYLVADGVIKLNFHSLVGLFALAVMGTHAFWALFAGLKIGKTHELFHKYSRYALAVWLIAFATGIIMGIANH